MLVDSLNVWIPKLFNIGGYLFWTNHYCTVPGTVPCTPQTPTGTPSSFIRSTLASETFNFLFLLKDLGVHTINGFCNPETLSSASTKLCSIPVIGLKQSPSCSTRPVHPVVNELYASQDSYEWEPTHLQMTVSCHNLHNCGKIWVHGNNDVTCSPPPSQATQASQACYIISDSIKYRNLAL